MENHFPTFGEPPGHMEILKHPNSARIFRIVNQWHVAYTVNLLKPFRILQVSNEKTLVV